MSRIAPLVAWIALGCFTTLWAQEYEVIYHRPAKVGQVTLTHVEFSEEQSDPSVPGAADSEDPMKADLEVLLTVLEIDDTGKPTEFKMEVKSSSCLVHKKTSPIYAVGDVIRVKGRGSFLYVNEKPAAMDQRLVLMHLFPVWFDQSPNVTDGPLCQPDHRVKIGETWSFHRDPWPTESQQGDMKLEDLQTKEGIPCLHVTSNVQLQIGSPPKVRRPASLVVPTTDRYSISIKTDCELPLDRSLGIRSQTVERLRNTEKSYHDESGKAYQQEQSVIFTRLKIESIPVPGN